MIERKPSAAALARAVNLSPVNPSSARENSADIFCVSLELGDKIFSAHRKEFEREIKRSNERGKFANDFYGKFNGEPFRAAAKSVKFKNKTRAKTLASAQIKFDPSASPKRELFSLTNLTVRTANQTRANLTHSESSEAGVKFSFKFNQKALK
nr:hypothetical protein [uncultured Campylobacter sp.]